MAEVLITLAVIGIVAAMTIPTLIQSHQEKVTVTKLKKFYSVISQAFEMAKIGNGDLEDVDLGGDGSVAGANALLDYFKSYIKTTKTCYSNTGCFPNVVYKHLNNIPDMNINLYEAASGRAILNDGMSIYFYTNSQNCTEVKGELKNICGSVFVDVNGFKSPNQWGKDLFPFWIAKDGIYPRGMSAETTTSFNNQCLAGGNGRSCTAWVILNENMDYLYCNDLSWNGKHKCD